MGNSASNANNPNRTQRTDHSPSRSPSINKRDDSISPGPGNPHPSLRTKKKSLELPDFASLTLNNSTISARGRQKAYAPATAIPIPTPPAARNPFSHYESFGIQPQRHRPRNNFSSTISISHVQDDFDGMSALDSPTTPFPPPSRAQQREQQQHQREQHQRQQQQQRSASKQRGRQPPTSGRQQAQARMQELYDQSLDPHHSAVPSTSSAPASRPTYSREVVRSSIPVLLGATSKQAETQESNVLSPIQEDLSADPVSLTVVWKGGGKEVTLARAGDDDWQGRQPMERQSPDSNIWTANVCLRPGAHHVRFFVDGQWRVADDLPTAVDDQGSLANYVAVYGIAPPPPQLSSPPGPVPVYPPPATRKMVPGQSFWSATSADGDNDTDDTPHPPKILAKHPQNAAAIAYVQAKWTNILPLELIEAQKEEEVYLAASAGQFEAQQQQASSGRVVVAGFIPAPNIPAAPGLPRHLDRLILNSRVGEKPVDRAGTPGSQGSGVGSGQGGGRRRDRENRERERERERDREKDRERERDRERDRDRDRDRDRAGRSRRPNVPPPPPPSEDGSAELDIESTYVPMNPNAAAALRHQTDSSSSSGAGNSNISTAATTPHVSVPATPTLSPKQSSRKLTIMEGQSRSLAVRSSFPQPPPVERAPISDSRIITIDTSKMPAMTDDAAVMPVPSHVVLHHLCTSAIKNGVLAVANTTRYRKKYLTTIYYKPT